MCDRVTDFCHKRSKKETENSMKNNKKTCLTPTIKKAIKKAAETYESKKLKAANFKVPKDMDEAKDFC